MMTWITIVRLLTRFGPEDAFFEDLYVPTKQLAEVVALADALGVEHEEQMQSLSPVEWAAKDPIGYVKSVARKQKDPQIFEGLKAEFYAIVAKRAA